ncbi:MAG: hypothetical protein IIY02_00325, partial [Firmicutes bacterium]|nr:hypothetical protein [Bacillota bacterium]
MSSQVTNYKCPACTGPLHFDGALGKLKCDYCESTFDVAEIEAQYAEANEKAEAAMASAEEKSDDGWSFEHNASDWGAEDPSMRIYGCPSCGAELICDETTAATSCPYCGNPTIVPGQFSGIMKPDYVIPFKLDKNAAVSALKQHYKGKILLPKEFASQNHLEEIKGIYVPFWLFDGAVDADVMFKCTRSHVHMRGDEQVTITEHFNVRRAGSMEFSRIPVDASSKMPDEYMDSIEPFHYEEMVPFSKGYLPGFFADKYDVTLEESSERADRRVRNTALEVFRRDAAGLYQTCTPVSQSMSLTRGEVSYALLPVWVLHTKWQDR